MVDWLKIWLHGSRHGWLDLKWGMLAGLEMVMVRVLVWLITVKMAWVWAIDGGAVNEEAVSWDDIGAGSEVMDGEKAEEHDGACEKLELWLQLWVMVFLWRRMEHHGFDLWWMQLLWFEMRLDCSCKRERVVEVDLQRKLKTSCSWKGRMGGNGKVDKHGCKVKSKTCKFKSPK